MFYGSMTNLWFNSTPIKPSKSYVETIKKAMNPGSAVKLSKRKNS